MPVLMLRAVAQCSPGQSRTAGAVPGDACMHGGTLRMGGKVTAGAPSPSYMIQFVMLLDCGDQDTVAIIR